MTDPGGGIAAAITFLRQSPCCRSPGDPRVRRRKTEHRRVGTSGGEGCGGFARGHRKRLPITCGDEPDLDDWYRANVIGGPGAFLNVANGFEAFAAAFRQKLTLEVAGLTP